MVPTFRHKQTHPTCYQHPKMSPTPLFSFSVFVLVLMTSVAPSTAQSSCPCPKIFLPVCCRTNNSLYPETKPNACRCACAGGTVLFQRRCTQPPRKIVPCPRILAPTCCFLRKYPMVFSALNECDCTDALHGVPIPSSFCENLG